MYPFDQYLVTAKIKLCASEIMRDAKNDTVLSVTKKIEGEGDTFS